MWSPFRTPDALSAAWRIESRQKTREGSRGSLRVNGQPSAAACGSRATAELKPPCTKARSRPHSSSSSATRSTA